MKIAGHSSHKKKNAANQQEFGQPHTSHGEPIAPGKWIVLRFPVIAPLVAKEFYIARVEHFMRATAIFATTSRRHPLHVTPEDRFQNGATESSPGEFQPHAHAAAWLDRLYFTWKRFHGRA